MTPDDPSSPRPTGFRVAQPQLRGAVRELARVPGRPNVVLGLRAAIDTIVPVLAATALGAGEMATWPGLGGFIAAVTDKGGAYRTRAQAMGSLTVVATLATILGALASGKPAISVPLVFVIALVLAMLRAYGSAPGSVGVSGTNVFVISLSAPAHGVHDALLRGALAFAGCAFATAVSLLFWPVRAYAPARRALAVCYRELAGYAETVAEGRARDFAGFRTALEAARDTLAATRRGRPGESGRGERLLMLAEFADRTFVALAALGGMLDTAAGTDPEDEARSRADAAAVASLARELADAVERERRPAPLPQAFHPAPVADDAPVLARLDAAVRREAAFAWASAAGVESGRRVVMPALPADPGPGVGEVLRENLTFHSIIFRHALRVAVTAAAALWLAHALGLKRGYWVVLTALIILQPSAGATWVKGLQRIGGTVAGGLLAAAIADVLHAPAAMMAVIFVLAAAAVSMLGVNYGIYAVFLTPTFVLLAESAAPAQPLAGVRVVNTLIGGALALLASRVLWPSPERLNYRGRMAAALRAAGGYVRAAARAYAGAVPRAELDAARRQCGLAILNAEEALQHLLWAERTSDDAEAGMAAAAFVRRLGEAANSLGYSAPAARVPGASGVAEFGGRVDDALETLASCVEAHCPPGADSAAPTPPRTGDATLDARLAAMAQEVSALHRVLARGGEGQPQAA